MPLKRSLILKQFILTSCIVEEPEIHFVLVLREHEVARNSFNYGKNEKDIHKNKSKFEKRNHFCLPFNNFGVVSHPVEEGLPSSSMSSAEKASRVSAMLLC